jgi:hypothetical protein
MICFPVGGAALGSAAQAQRQAGSLAGRPTGDPAGRATADGSRSVIAKPTGNPVFEFE